MTEKRQCFEFLNPSFGLSYFVRFTLFKNTFLRIKIFKFFHVLYCWNENNSVVTDFIRSTKLAARFDRIGRKNEIFISFDLVVTSANLCYSNYSSYQYKLYRLVKFLKENRGVGYRRISHIMTQKGYRSSRTNSILKPNYIYSIYKKGKIREERYGRTFESRIENTFCYVL